MYTIIVPGYVRVQHFTKNENYLKRVESSIN